MREKSNAPVAGSRSALSNVAEANSRMPRLKVITELPPHSPMSL